MRDPWPEILERCRIKDGEWGSRPGDRYGAFTLRPRMLTVAFDEVETELRIIANAANRESAWWEHVSVSTPGRCPTWEEMVCFVNHLFWDEDELVVQFHPRKIDYVNCHPYTLHLWRPTRHKDRMPMPPSHLVGPK